MHRTSRPPKCSAAAMTVASIQKQWHQERYCEFHPNVATRDMGENLVLIPDPITDRGSHMRRPSLDGPSPQLQLRQGLLSKRRPWDSNDADFAATGVLPCGCVIMLGVPCCKCADIRPSAVISALFDFRGHFDQHSGHRDTARPSGRHNPLPCGETPARFCASGSSKDRRHSQLAVRRELGAVHCGSSEYVFVVVVGGAAVGAGDVDVRTLAGGLTTTVCTCPRLVVDLDAAYVVRDGVRNRGRPKASLEMPSTQIAASTMSCFFIAVNLRVKDRVRL